MTMLANRNAPAIASRLQAGKTPGIVFSGPGGEQQLLAFESKALSKVVTKLGRTAWACSVFDLQIRSEDGSSNAVRALVRSTAQVPRCPCCHLFRTACLCMHTRSACCRCLSRSQQASAVFLRLRCCRAVKCTWQQTQMQ